MLLVIGPFKLAWANPSPYSTWTILSCIWLKHIFCISECYAILRISQLISQPYWFKYQREKETERLVSILETSSISQTIPSIRKRLAQVSEIDQVSDTSLNIRHQTKYQRETKHQTPDQVSDISLNIRHQSKYQTPDQVSDISPSISHQSKYQTPVQISDINLNIRHQSKYQTTI